MGYSINFCGQFNLDRPLAEEHYEYLVKFNETRRVKRDAAIASKLPDTIREAVGLPIGLEGAYFVGETEGKDDSITGHNTPPNEQPNLWCGWRPTNEENAIEWDDREKFYCSIEWIKYLVNHFLNRWGYILNGQIQWFGENYEDTGIISISNNVTTILSMEELQAINKDRISNLEAALKEILSFKNNPVRRNKHGGNPDYKAPDWIATKDRIFSIAEKSLK